MNHFYYNDFSLTGLLISRGTEYDIFLSSSLVSSMVPGAWKLYSNLSSWFCEMWFVPEIMLAQVVMAEGCGRTRGLKFEQLDFSVDLIKDLTRWTDIEIWTQAIWTPWSLEGTSQYNLVHEPCLIYRVDANCSELCRHIAWKKTFTFQITLT